MAMKTFECRKLFGFCDINGNKFHILHNIYMFLLGFQPQHTCIAVCKTLHVIPCHDEGVFRDIEIYFHVLLLLKTQMMWVVGVDSQEWQIYSYFTESIPWLPKPIISGQTRSISSLLMPWILMSPGNQQQCYWPGLHGIFQSQHQKD